MSHLLLPGRLFLCISSSSPSCLCSDARSLRGLPPPKAETASLSSHPFLGQFFSAPNTRVSQFASTALCLLAPLECRPGKGSSPCVSYCLCAPVLGGSRERKNEGPGSSSRGSLSVKKKGHLGTSSRAEQRGSTRMVGRERALRGTGEKGGSQGGREGGGTDGNTNAKGVWGLECAGCGLWDPALVTCRQVVSVEDSRLANC